MQKVYIRCPKCYWEPDDNQIWVCDVCKTRWNTFHTNAQCPSCGKVYDETQCRSCKVMSANKDWYEIIEIDEENKHFKKFQWPWKRQLRAPVTDNDRKWIEQSLISICDLFTPEYFRSLRTLAPDNDFFDGISFKTEEDIDRLFHKIADFLDIETWELHLMFFRNRPTEFSEGITATPSDQLRNRWKYESSKTIDHGFGNKEIWIDFDQLDDPQQLTASLAYELTKYKLATDYQHKDDLMVAELATIVFGFGIFLGNSYFKFTQWTGITHHGWQMSKKGILPEQMIAYAVAWLTHYRDENLALKVHFNKTVKKYFEQSYKYIDLHQEQIRWPKA